MLLFSFETESGGFSIKESLEKGKYQIQVLKCCSKYAKIIKKKSGLNPYKAFNNFEIRSSIKDEKLSSALIKKTNVIFHQNPKSPNQAIIDLISDEETPPKKIIFQISILNLKTKNKIQEIGFEIESIDFDSFL